MIVWLCILDSKRYTEIQTPKPLNYRKSCGREEHTLWEILVFQLVKDIRNVSNIGFSITVNLSFSRHILKNSNPSGIFGR